MMGAMHALMLLISIPACRGWFGVDGRSSDGLGTGEIVIKILLHLFKGRWEIDVYKALLTH
jgi:hypothetical protein